MQILIANTVYYILMANLVIAFISMKLVSGKLSDNALFQDYPVFSTLGLGISLVIIGIPMLFCYLISNFTGSLDILDDYIKTKTIIFWIINSGIIFIILLFLGLTEFKKATNNGILALIGILGFSLGTAVCNGAAVTYYSNYIFDFSQGEERVVNITNSVHWKSRGRHATDYYQLNISPAIGTDKLNVSMFLQEEAKKGDKLKIYIRKGFCGIRYVGLKKELIKAEPAPKK